MSTVDVTTFIIGDERTGQKVGNVPVQIPESLGVLEDGGTIAANQCVIRIINQKDGDKRVVWDSRVLQQINDAKKMFADLVAQHLRPYKVDPSGKRTPEIMTQFDPTAEEIIFAPDASPVLTGG